MDDLESGALDSEGEGNLIAAAQQIARALASKRELTDEERKALVHLRAQLSTFTLDSEKKKKNIEEGASREEHLDVIHEKIMRWENDQSMIWDLGQDEAYQYLNAVDETWKLIERLENSHSDMSVEKDEMLRNAHDVLQTAMVRLEEEFKHMLLQNRRSIEPEHTSFRSSEEDAAEVGSMISSSFDDSLRRDSFNRISEESLIDLVHPEILPDLRCIANLMCSSGYEHECSQAYVNLRRDALDECLFIVEMEKHCIEDVLRMEWATLNFKIKKWVRAVRVFVRVYLASEKWLSDQIFGEASLNLSCFIEASKAAILQLLNFGEAISIGSKEPEKLFCFLEMYEVMSKLSPDIDDLFPDEAGSFIRTQYHELQQRLGKCIRMTFLEFKKAIASNASATAFPGGGVHHLTRYVMNYMKNLIDYGETLELLLSDHGKEGSNSFCHETNSPVEDEQSRVSGCGFPKLAPHFHGISSVLESNLDEKSNLYKDAGLQHIFLMNNVHYMAEKVKNSELRLIFGDDWIRKHNGKFQQHALSYERSTWSSILSFLREEGLHSSGSGSVSQTLLRERLKNFSLAFEEVYRAQTAWVIPDVQLREDLRISTSLKIVQAYRTFVGRHNGHLSDRHIKYTADDLENYILDLFEGSPKSLPNPYRR